MNVLLCRVFGQSEVNWKDANWLWSDCKECVVWSRADAQWKDAGWYWPTCQVRPIPPEDCWIWGDTYVRWKDANWLWSRCSASVPTEPISLQPPGVDATTLIQPWLIEPWNPYRAGEKRKKKKIQLTCRIDGVDYKEERQSFDMNLSIDDVRLKTEKSNTIDLDMRLE